jgi:hypothetical protein
MSSIRESESSWRSCSRNFFAHLGISQYRLAQAIGVPPRRINEIVPSNCAGAEPGSLG